MSSPSSTQPPQPRDRRLLFIGDSITAGYGVLCNDTAAPFAAETESAYHTYAAVAARALDADAHVIAFSGKGVDSCTGRWLLRFRPHGPKIAAGLLKSSVLLCSLRRCEVA